MKKLLIFLVLLLMVVTEGRIFSVAKKKANTHVVLLGTGSPVPDPDRFGPAFAIIVNGSSYLVDCGVGCVRRAIKASQEKNIDALSVSNLNIVFISHLHSDHTLGYPDLMLTPWDHRTKPLEVYGPVGIQDMTDHILKAYAQDIKVRTNGLQKSKMVTLKPNVHEIKPGVIYQDSNIKVTAFLVGHGTFIPSFGFKFETPDKTIVFSGDTHPSDELVKQAKNVDMLIHEVSSMDKYEKAPEDIQRYLKAFHTSTQELAAIASKANPKLLIPTHILGHKDIDMAQIKKEIQQAGHKGKIADSYDLAVFGDVPPQTKIKKQKSLK